MVGDHGMLYRGGPNPWTKASDDGPGCRGHQPVREWSPMSISDDLKDFIAAHRDHGQLTGDATEPGLAGYHVWIACSWHDVLPSGDRRGCAHRSLGVGSAELEEERRAVAALMDRRPELSSLP